MKHTKTHLKGYLTYSFIITNNHMHFLSAFPLLFDSRDGLPEKERLSVVYCSRTFKNHIEPTRILLNPSVWFDFTFYEQWYNLCCPLYLMDALWIAENSPNKDICIPSCTSLGAARMSCHDQFTRTLRLFSLHEEHNYDYYYYMRCIPLFGRKRKNQRLSPLCKETNKLFLFFFIPTNIHHSPLSCSSKYLCI